MLQPGRIVSDYEVEAELGAGGIATVYRVLDRRNGAVRALKVLHVQTPTIRQRLEFEGQIQSALRHPNIVPVHDVLQVDGWPALVMEFIDGPSLQKWLSTRRVKVSVAERLFRGIVDGVALAHEHGLVHRDLKPANILVATEGGQPVPKVTDFGLARLVLEDQDFALSSRSGIAIGTPGYMALEQLTDPSRVDQRADIFALGCILYELLTGKRAYDGPDVLAIFNRVALGRYIPPQELTDGLPAHLVNAVTGCLHPLRDERIADCGRLRQVLDGASLSSLPPHDPADVDAARVASRRTDSLPPEPAEAADAASDGPLETGADGALVATAVAGAAVAGAAMAASSLGEPEASEPEAAADEAEPVTAAPAEGEEEPLAAFGDEASAASAPVTHALTHAVEPLDQLPASPAAGPEAQLHPDDEPIAAGDADTLDALPADEDEEVGPAAAAVRVMRVNTESRGAARPAAAAAPPDPQPADEPETVGPAQVGAALSAAAAALAGAVDTDSDERGGGTASVTLPASAGRRLPTDTPTVADVLRAPLQRDDAKTVGGNTKDLTPRGSGLPLPAGAATGSAVPDERPAPGTMTPRDARAAIGRIRDQMQPPAQSSSSLLPYLAIGTATVVAVMAGMWWNDQQSRPGRVTPTAPPPPAVAVTAPPPVSGTDLALAGTTPAIGVSESPTESPAVPAVEATPVEAPETAASPRSDGASAPTSEKGTAEKGTSTGTPTAPATGAGRPPAEKPAEPARPAASGGSAVVKVNSDAVENFLVPTDPGTTITRLDKGAHTLSPKPGAYTVVARFAGGQTPYFLDLDLKGGATCEVTCSAVTESCQATGSCGRR